MSNEIRDCVLGMVAGMRGEKRAAKARALRFIMGKLRRGKELLTGSRRDRLERHIGVMGDNAKSLKGRLDRAEDAYKDLFHSDPLRTHNISRRRGDMDIVPRPAVDIPTPNDSLLAQHKSVMERLPGLERLRNVLESRNLSMEYRLGQLGRMLAGEANAVRNARLAAGGIGALALGGTGYGTYKVLAGNEDRRAQV